MRENPAPWRVPAISRNLVEAAKLLKIQSPAGSAEITGISLDSRLVQAGDLYVALAGGNTHGARYAAQALRGGAAAVLTDRAGAALLAQAPVPVLEHENPRSVLGQLSAWIYADPSRSLKVIGITGTNGKTTVAALIESAAQACGVKVGVIGTTGTRVNGRAIPTSRTTPEAPQLQALLAHMRNQGVEIVALEVSSHALELGRVNATCFEQAVFTNLSADHLDFHQDLGSYFQAKAQLFSPDRTRRALINLDDPWGAKLLSEVSVPALSFATGRSGAAALTGSGSGTSDWYCDEVESVAGGYRYRLRGPGVDQLSTLRLPGRFNLSNAVAAAAASISGGLEPAGVAAGIGGCVGAPGRMERVAVAPGVDVIVDYAHTPDAVNAVVSVGRELADRSNGRLLVVIGAGGDRDRRKRPVMGAAAARLADLVIVTDDNPRSEDPALIRQAVVAGAREGRAVVMEVADRPDAIRAAVSRAESGDVVLVLGKGHESGQEIGGIVYPMDDRQLVREALGELTQ